MRKASNIICLAFGTTLSKVPKKTNGQWAQTPLPTAGPRANTTALIHHGGPLETTLIPGPFLRIL